MARVCCVTNMLNQYKAMLHVIILYLNFKLSNEKAQFVTREHEIKYDIKPTSSFSEPAFLLTMFPGEHGVEHYSCQPRETTRTTSAKWRENFMLFKSKWRRWRRAQSPKATKKSNEY